MFAELAVAMVALGLLVGVLFPPVTVVLGVPPSLTRRPTFFAATLTAGLIVGALNYLLARRVVGARIRTLAASMTHVGNVIRDAAYTGDWSRCAPADCTLPVDSDDEIGEAATAFNGLLRALHNARAIENSLSGFTSAISQHLGLDMLADVMLRGMVECLEAEGGALYLVDGDDVEACKTWRLPAELVDWPVLQDAMNAHTANLFTIGQPARPDPAGEDRHARVLLAVPLRSHDTTLGGLLIGFREQPSPNVLRLVDVLSDTATVALNNAIAHQRLQTLATIDSLTGVHNRRVGLARLEDEWRRAEHDATALGVLMIDLDHFKRVNDTYGHHSGDEVLRQVADAARTVVRDRDLIMRTGGEEFAMILPGANLDQVRQIGERLRAAIATATISVGDTDIHVTASVGGAAFPEHPSSSATELLRHADTALYTAKRLGRDRLAIYPLDSVTH